MTVPKDPAGEYESCRMFTPVELKLEVIEAYGLNSTEKCRDGWIHQAPRGSSTLITEVRGIS